MEKLKWTTVQRKVADLIPCDFNPRSITEEGKEKMKKSLEEFDLVEIPVIDYDEVIIAGHQRIEALFVLDRGEEIIDVRFPNRKLTEYEFKKYMLVSNKHAGFYDFSEVAEHFADFDLEEFDFALANLDEEEKLQTKVLDEVEEDDFDDTPPEEPETVLGDLYEIGNHRLLCGDSTDSDQVAKLMNGEKANLVVTDPPYNTGMKANKDAKARLSHMFNDSYTDEEWIKFITDFFNNYNLFTEDNIAFYVFIDWRRNNDIRLGLEKICTVKNIIVWDKGVHGLGSDYKSTYELCIVGKKGKPEINNRFGLDYQDIWRVQRQMGRNKEHATAKPVNLVSKPIKHASKENETVIDFFLGSGTTMLASHQLNRKCYGTELDPKYCDVIVKRMLKYDATLIIKRNGEDVTDFWKNKILETT